MMRFHLNWSFITCQLENVQLSDQENLFKLLNQEINFSVIGGDDESF